jgi:hypothetical protein
MKCLTALLASTAVLCLVATTPTHAQTPTARVDIAIFYEPYDAASREWLINQLNATWAQPGMDQIMAVTYIAYGGATEKQGPGYVCSRTDMPPPPPPPTRDPDLAPPLLPVCAAATGRSRVQTVRANACSTGCWPVPRRCTVTTPVRCSPCRPVCPVRVPIRCQQRSCASVRRV